MTNLDYSFEPLTKPAGQRKYAAARQRASAVIRSPFFMMPLWIALSALLYLLGWSTLFADIRLDLALFLAGACVLFLLFAVVVDTKHSSRASAPLNWWALGAITAYFVGAFVKGGGIPILQILLGDGYDVYGFGINGLHIFMLSFTGYYGVRACMAFISTKRPQDLIALAWIFMLLGAIGNRSAASFLAFSCAYLFFRSRLLSWQTWAALGAALLLFAYGFGVFGDVRLMFQIEQATGAPGASDAVLQYSRASESFMDTGLSPSWLWAYLYFVSPLANLNEAFAFAQNNACTFGCGPLTLVFYDMMPDAIGDRLAGFFGVSDFDKSNFLIAPDVTASTTFGSAVGMAGIAGGLVMVLLIIAVCWIAVRLLEGSAVREEGLAILATIVFFSFFENMIAYTALFGQLVIVIAVARLGRPRRQELHTAPDTLFRARSRSGARRPKLQLR